MTDFDRQQHDYWFAEACRYAELVGGIEAWANFPLDKRPHARVTPTRALAQIRQLLALHKAAQPQRQPVGGERL